VGRNRNSGRSSARKKNNTPHPRRLSKAPRDAKRERAGPPQLNAHSLALTFAKSLLVTAVLCAATLSAFALGSSSQDASHPPRVGR
jgi:hypothetical protein